LFMHSWLMSIFATNNASQISKLTWKQAAMVAKILQLELQHLLFNHWPFKRSYARARWSS
jgi:hypothetical protein